MDKTETILLGIACFLLGGTITLIITIITSQGTYKDGQIDALNGKIYYCLVEQDNLELNWEYNPEGCAK